MFNPSAGALMTNDVSESQWEALRKQRLSHAKRRVDPPVGEDMSPLVDWYPFQSAIPTAGYTLMKNASWRGAGIGALIGTGAGAFTAKDKPVSEVPRHLILSGLGGAAIGGGIGLGVNAGVRKVNGVLAKASEDAANKMSDRAKALYDELSVKAKKDIAEAAQDSTRGAFWNALKFWKKKQSSLETKDNNGYLSMVRATAPAVAIKSLADVPRGFIENSVDSKLRKGTWNPATSAKGSLGRTLGGVTVGALTAPIFISGLKDIQSGDPDKRRSGMRKLVASSTIQAFGKGVTEGIFKDSLKTGLREGSAKMVTNLPGVLAAAYAMKKNKDQSTGKAALTGVLAGSAAGALKGAAEEVIQNAGHVGNMIKNPAFRKANLSLFGRGVYSRMAGRAAGGALGGLSLSLIGKKMLQDKKD